VILSPQELAAYTGKDKPGWQRRQLDAWGIPYKVRSDKTLAVLRVHVEGLQDPQPRRPTLRLQA
jgi:hypothetical protein